MASERHRLRGWTLHLFDRYGSTFWARDPSLQMVCDMLRAAVQPHAGYALELRGPRWSPRHMHV